MPRSYVRIDPVERVLARIEIDPDTGCWLFQGVSRADGYGAVATGGKGSPKILAHRLLYDRLVSPITDDVEVHHECGRRPCCNPEHLIALDGTAHRHEHRRSTCARGHSNWRTKRDGTRECRECHRLREAEKRAARRASS